LSKTRPRTDEAPLLLLLMLDAFRPDYLAGAPFLSGLARQGWLGRYQEPFGYTPHDSYFRGATPAESGATHMFRLDPQSSPFGPARHFPSESTLSNETRLRLRDGLRRHAATQVSTFAASYIHPFEIPFHLLAEFHLAEQTPPWRPGPGRPSVFEDLSAAGRDWLYLAWPLFEEQGLRTDEDVARRAAEQIVSSTEFAFVQLPDLDAAGHQFGPGSPELLHLIRRQDMLVSDLFHALHHKGIRPTVLFYGDHGMVNTVRGLDVVSPLAATGLSAPADFVYFLDSTAARLWYRHPGARSRIRAALDPLPGLHRLTPEDLRRYGMEGIHPANGEDIYLADPGVLLAPNFFHHSRHLPRGMHGYAPEAPDNQGLFLLCGEGITQPRRLGVVLPDTFHAVLHALLFEPGVIDTLLPPQPSPPIAGAAQVEADLAAALRRILPLLHPGDSVVLHGGFGRGEGTLLYDGTRYRALNDYDVMVVGPGPRPDIPWKDIGAELATSLGLPYFDFGWIDRDLLAQPPRSLFFYDFLHGSRVLHGDPHLLNNACRFAPAEIAEEEGIRLLLNRVAGVLIGLTAACLPPALLSASACEFLNIQMSKLGMAIADRRLLSWQAYDVRYAVRRRRFAELAHAAQFPANWIPLLRSCYDWKLSVHTPPFPDPRPALAQLAAIAGAELAATLDAPAADLSAAITHFIHSRPSGLHGDKMRCRAACALLLDALDDNLQPIETRLRAAAPLIAVHRPQPPPKGPHAFYEHLRLNAVTAWENLCH
jgi:predicted AlkP superfamily pyrophosphatase or phosphodiesterase